MDRSDEAPERRRERTEGLAPRGRAHGGDPAGTRWTRDAVDRALAPFVALSQAVPGNRRKAHVPGGGGRRSGELRVDAYSGIKANGLNYVLNCFIAEKGDEPVFALFDWGAGHAVASWRDVVARADRVFGPDQLGEALEAWRGIAERAGMAR